MGFKGVHHVVVRVADLESAVASYEKILEVKARREHSDALKADQAFFDFENGTFLELISPTDESSPVSGSLRKLGDGIHTVAFSVDDPEATAQALEARGVRTVGGAFVHPSAANGVLLQLSDEG